MDNHVKLVEVGPRDGLQNEAEFISSSNKIILTNLLSAAGFKSIEVTSFVSPRWVPQLKDAHEVMTNITRHADVSYIALTPNLKGLDAAIAAQADEIAIFAAASETFSSKNINCTIAESLQRFTPVINKAKQINLPIRGYISCVVGCPYEGEVEPAIVFDIAQWMIEQGCYEVSLGDTIGCGTPQTVDKLLNKIIPSIQAEKIAGHYHDTNGRAVENIFTSLEYGIRTFDSAISGLGGCPYAPGAKGNVSTNKLHNALSAAGWNTGLNSEKLEQASQFVTSLGLGAR